MPIRYRPMTLTLTAVEGTIAASAMYGAVMFVIDAWHLAVIGPQMMLQAVMLAAGLVIAVPGVRMERTQINEARRVRNPPAIARIPS
ncbi:hypothetical protein EV385_5459 [Krasilnikovia cinnamomea]|uniref:Uncharacterized protein n=1 Tax=Krasilnikovia cinnamomea TaxID=349313 RepID=A0A4Q7ZQX9_9ACTN|nr:hypothetical protein [Krasilnikovia cinnamomea]RZU53530.1 hypothetical protein EV385_5459 [Krasilnikovia cinnamomea]